MTTLRDEIADLILPHVVLHPQAELLADAILSHLRERGVLVEWQPIETAPRDGTPILVTWLRDGVWTQPFVARWRAGRWADASDEYWGVPGGLDLIWMPLPEPSLQIPGDGVEAASGDTTNVQKVHIAPQAEAVGLDAPAPVLSVDYEALRNPWFLNGVPDAKGEG